MNRPCDIYYKTEYIKNLLYFATIRQGKIPENSSDTHYFSIDDELIYENYYADFGPLNLSCVYKYCKKLHEKLTNFMNKHIVIVHYTSDDPKRKANAAYLMASYGILYLNLSPIQAFKPLTLHGQNYRPFQDATPGKSNYTITIMDCLQALTKARQFGFFNFKDFNVDLYDKLNSIHGGDLNWIVPGKYLAFIGPVDYTLSIYHPPEMYIDYFLENEVKAVIRLNKKCYDEKVFVTSGLSHYDLYFPDGSCPRKHILLKFLQISEELDGAVAVHCKAGLGRTGTLIGCFLIKHYKMTAREAIAWMRICRPGSVIGNQQEYLEQIQAWLIKQGNLYRRRICQDINKLPIHEFGIYSIAEKIHKQKPFVLSKSPSPPQLIHRQNRSELTSPRARASQIREGMRKASEEERFQLQLKNIHRNQMIINKHSSIHPSGILSHNNSSGSTGRMSRNASVSRTITPNTPGRNYMNNESNLTKPEKFVPVQPYTFYTNAANSNEIKNFLMPDRRLNDAKENLLKTSIKVLPRYQFCVPEIVTGRSATKNITRIPSHYISTACNDQVQNRRRLGRSPSPPVMRRDCELTRATNTQPQYFHNKGLNDGINEALSNLRMSGPRGGSIGASSLGAQRDPPAGRRAPSVRSDDRSNVTQGDMLNSIKLQRKLRENFASDKNSTIFKDKYSVRTNVTKPGSGTLKPVNKQGSFSSNEKFIPSSSRPSPTTPRPSSPPPRRPPKPQFF